MGLLRILKADMLVLLLVSLVATALAAPSAKAGPHGFYGHVYHGPPCTHVLVEKTKEVCYYEPEKKCETKTSTYKVITGYEKGDCKEVEVCKHPPWRRRRPRTMSSATSPPRRCVRRRPSRCPPSPARRRRRRRNRRKRAVRTANNKHHGPFSPNAPVQSL